LSGARLWESPDDQTIDERRAHHPVLVFRRQTLSEHELADFSALFGPLEEIYEYATRPEVVYRHHWRLGDVLRWDNGFTMHRRVPFDPSARRLMKRTTIFLSRERGIGPEGSLAAAT
jgi:alpha-ketoglutarate-dependent taurine dioxygenase